MRRRKRLPSNRSRRRKKEAKKLLLQTEGKQKGSPKVKAARPKLQSLFQAVTSLVWGQTRFALQVAVPWLGQSFQLLKKSDNRPCRSQCTLLKMAFHDRRLSFDWSSEMPLMSSLLLAEVPFCNLFHFKIPRLFLQTGVDEQSFL